MTGTIINVITVLIGGTLGLIFGSKLPARIRQTVVAGLGLFTLGYGLSQFLKTENAIVTLLSLLIGGILGEWWRIEDGLSNLGAFLERKLPKSGQQPKETEHPQSASATSSQESSRFARGFLTASLVFCVGPMTIMGSIQDGIEGNFLTLAIKSVLDGFAAMAFASTFGVGVLFSVITVFLFQGGLSLLAAQAEAVITPVMMNELTAVGGLILIGIAVSSLLEIKPIRVGNFLPALLVAPLLVPVIGPFLDWITLVLGG